MAAGGDTGSRNETVAMKQQVGFFLQLAVLALLPVVSYLELSGELHLLFIPTCLVIGLVLFLVGWKLRES